jgi:hypothetical protein
MSTADFDAWPLDAQGRLLPLVPVRATFQVPLFEPTSTVMDSYRVAYASAQKFIVRGPRAGEEKAWSADDWGRFLDEVASKGPVRMHFSGCRNCYLGCDGSAVGRGQPGGNVFHGGCATAQTAIRPGPAELPPGPGRAREATLFRAGRELLNRGAVKAAASDRFEVDAGRRVHTVTVCPSWSRPPACDCATDAERATQGYCRHVVAVLLSRPELSAQLLEILL